MATSSAKTLSSSLKKLEISSKSKHEEPVDSWDADEDSSTEEDDSGNATPVRPTSSSDYPGAPPPTPSSPSFSSGKTAQGAPYQTFPPYGFQAYGDAESTPARGSRTMDENERRPEKSTAVASRLIAAGIGQKAPRRTKEQREYDQATKMQEKKKRDQVKAEEERRKNEAVRAKQAVWDD